MIAAPPVRDTPRRAARALPGRPVAERVVAPAVVLAVACLLRLPFPDLTPFGHDEALEAARARPIWFGARPVDSEITSWWIPDPAGLLYFFALAEAFDRPAVARALLVALANVGAVLLTYALARRFFGPRAALAAGLLYAANPWAATFGRQPWVITQPLLTALMLFAAMMVVARRDRRWIVPFFVAGAAQTQTHMLAVLYGPPVLLTFLIFWRRWLAPHLVPAVAVALLMVAPYALHLWELRDDILAALDRGNRGLTLAPDPTAATQAFWLISGLQIERKLGVPDALLDGLRGPLFLVAALAVGLLLGGIALGARACLARRPGWEAHALLLIWFLAPLALMTWQSSQVFIHYALVLLPTPFLLMGLTVAAPWERTVAPVAPPVPPVPGGSREAPRTGGTTGPAATRPSGPGRAAIPAAALEPLALGALACVVGVHALAVVGFYAALERMATAPPTATTPTEHQAALNRVELTNKQLGIGELHGLPLRYWQMVADRTRAAARANGVRDIVVMTGIQDDANRHLDRRRKALDYLLGPDLDPRFPLEGLVVLPGARPFVVLTIPEQDLPRLAARGAARLVEERLPGTSGATRAWLVPPRPPRELVSPRVRADAAFENGARLLGVEAPRAAAPGQTIPLITYWLVERPPAPDGPDVAPFVELTAGPDGAGEARARARRGGLPSRQWREGDVLVQRASLTVPVATALGEYALAVGLSAPGNSDRVPLADGSGRDALPAATLAVRAAP